jgi:decaprenylphospho-beta-D-ribofuranose 2-oxidase
VGNTVGMLAELSGWGGTNSSIAQLIQVDSAAEIARHIQSCGPRGAISLGLGRSGGDAALNAGGDGFVFGPRLQRPAVRWVDWERRLALISGCASLAVINQELLAQGWCLPIVARTANVTAGGAVACDLHGPSHFARGSLGANIHRLELVDGRGGLLSLEPKGEKAAAYWSTVGGLGLTGVILDLEVSVVPVSTSWMLVDTTRCTDGPTLLDALSAAAAKFPYSYARIDTAAVDLSRGRGIVYAATHAGVLDLPPSRRATALEQTHQDEGRWRPLLPARFVSRKAAKALQSGFFRSAPTSRTAELVPHANYFHPDDVGVLGGLQLDGGTLHYEFMVPDTAVGLIDNFLAVLHSLSTVGQRAYLYRFGSAPRGPLSFAQAGWALSIELPRVADGLAAALDGFDERVADAGGRVFLALDGRLRPELVQAMYPQLAQWRAARRQLDPMNRFNSDLARRLNL